MHETLCVCVCVGGGLSVCLSVCHLMPEIVCNLMLENTVSNDCPCPKQTNKQTNKQWNKMKKTRKIIKGGERKAPTPTPPTKKAFPNTALYATTPFMVHEYGSLTSRPREAERTRPGTICRRGNWVGKNISRTCKFRELVTGWLRRLNIVVVLAVVQ